MSNQNGSNTIWKRLFIGILGLQAVLELVVGGTFLFSFQTALESGFGITYNSELEVLGTALGIYLLLLTTLLIVSIVWTIKNNYAGITMGIIIGAFLLVFGVVSFLKFGQVQAIMIDSLRGLLTIILAYMAGKGIEK
jgi:hypothetical protein